MGLDADDARIAAQILVQSDMRGVLSHGTVMLPLYVAHFQGGGADPRAKPEVVQDGPAWAILDAKGGLGHLAAYKAVHIAMEKARGCGVGMVGTRRANHLGPVGAYALMCAEQDMVGLTTCNTNVVMAATGSCERSIGNNPLAFAAPAGQEPPIVLDFACSAAAGSKVAMAAQDGTPIPEEWTIDAQGNPTTDPLDYLERMGALLPFAGHKGYGLAMMVEVLAGVLTGASLTTDVNHWVDQTDQVADEGYAFIAIDIGSLMPLESFRNRMDMLIQRIRGSRKANGVDRIYVPGEMEHEREQAAKANGISLKPWHLESLQTMAADLGLQQEFDALV